MMTLNDNNTVIVFMAMYVDEFSFWCDSITRRAICVGIADVELVATWGLTTLIEMIVMDHI